MTTTIQLVEDLHLALPASTGPGWPVIAAGCAAAALLLSVGLWWFLRRRKARLARPVPPEQTALRALDLLWQSRETVEAREFALRISKVLRSYIEGRFGLLAPKRSTEEFLAEARESAKLEEADRLRVGNFLLHCDRVNFALGSLALEDKAALHREAVRFVNDTTAAAQRAEALAPSTTP